MTELKDLQMKEFDLWEKFKNGDKKAGHNLLKSLKPILNKHVMKWSGSGVPYGVLMGDAKMIAMKSIGTYDPERGTQLNTHLNSQLLKLSRTAYKFGPQLYVPEERQRRMKTFNDVKSMLESRLNREPNIDELAEELVWSPTDVSKMIKETQPTFLAGEYPPEISYMPKDETETILRYVYMDLTPSEKLVLEHTIGLNGKPKTKNLRDISKTTRLPYQEVRDARDSIAKKLIRGASLFTKR